MQRSSFLILVNLCMALYGLYYFYAAHLAAERSSLRALNALDRLDKRIAQLEGAWHQLDTFYLPYCVVFATLVAVQLLAHREYALDSFLDGISGAALYALFSGALLWLVSHYAVPMAVHTTVFVAVFLGVFLSSPLHRFQQRVRERDAAERAH